jgi:hypothetical protein
MIGDIYWVIFKGSDKQEYVVGLKPTVGWLIRIFDKEKKKATASPTIGPTSATCQPTDF